MKLFGLSELERISGIPSRTWRLHVTEGRLPHARIGRRIIVTEEQLRKFIADHTEHTPLKAEPDTEAVKGAAAARVARS